MLSFENVLQQAKALEAKRQALSSQIELLKSDISKLETELVSKYGADYEQKYNSYVAKVQEWEEANATATL